MIKAIEFKPTPLVSPKAHENHMKLYRGYVDNVNNLHERIKQADLKKADKNFSDYRSLKKAYSFNLNSVIIHEMFFRNCGDKKSEPPKEFLQYIGGDFDKWKDEFIATAKSARGWVMTCCDQRTGESQTTLQDTYSESLTCASPLVVIDMYEHGYFSDYPNEPCKYAEKFIDLINWDIVKKRIERIEVCV